MTLQCLVLTFTREGVEIRTLYRTDKAPNLGTRARTREVTLTVEGPTTSAVFEAYVERILALTVSLAEDLRLALDRARTIESAMEYSRRELAQHLDLKPSMSTKDWLEIREAIEAESDLETHRCKTYL